MSETLLPIQERRPADLQAVIDAETERLQTDMQGYAYHGTRNAYEFAMCASSLSFSQALQNEKQAPISALDVGTGAGHFITGSQWNPGDVVHGITAYDYRQNAELGARVKATDEAYRVGNAENFGAIEGLLPSYDLVVSRLMLRHLVDPVGTFEQIANRVNPGGILAVDAFRWATPRRDLSANFATVLEALDDAGYDLSTPFQPGYGRSLVECFDFPTSTDLVIWRNHAERPVRIPFDLHLSRSREGIPFASYTHL